MSRVCAMPPGCSKSAVAYFALSSGRNYWLCATHFDKMAKIAIESARNGLESARKLCKKSGIKF